MVFTTHTGNFPIGFRRGGGVWQNELPYLLHWAGDNGFSTIDVGNNADDVLAVNRAGLHVGSADLMNWTGLFSPSTAKRNDAIATNKEFIAIAAEAGVRNFFLVILPENAELTRKENFRFAVESLAALAPTLENFGARAVIEGWPGPGALGCTPETVRALFQEVSSSAIGLNYDPSHLIRMGIDPIRFLEEFAPRVGHVHGKDCEILLENIYVYGWEQPATFKKAPAFGGNTWRYTIPGHGNTNWSEVLRILVTHRYSGVVSIELEDMNYNGSDEVEKLGLLTSAQFLSSC